ncbi:hypothetical protein Goari_015501 [Gossypium aridum]|uniref:Uncharacterized protein n=1 Tax=Gossypium aridum TaxID=34290 RepID=A0A7J8WFX7_GOSAI|nr:hypothetical protein [Gossypium aridum]
MYPITILQVIFPQAITFQDSHQTVSLEIPGSVAIGFLLHATGLIPRREFQSLKLQSSALHLVLL